MIDVVENCRHRKGAVTDIAQQGINDSQTPIAAG
jgi:hypothetical protein